MITSRYRTAKNLVPGVRLAIDAVGGHRKLSRLLGISYQAIASWDRVPDDRLVEIEILTGIPREALRPDLYKGFKRTNRVSHFKRAER